MTVFRFAAGSVVLATLVACGGGGGGSSDTGGTATALKLTSSNYTAAAQESLVSASAVQGSSSFASLVTGADVADQAVVFRFARAQLPMLAAWVQTAPRLVTGVAQSITENCAGGGSVTGTLNDANDNSIFDAGDAVSLVATNCSFDGNYVNGSMTFNLNGLTGSLSTDVYNFSLALAFSSVTAITSAGTVTVNGSLTVAEQSTAYRTRVTTLTSGANLSVSGNFGGATSTRTLSQYTIQTTTTPSVSGYTESTTNNGTLASSGLGSQSLLVATTAPFVQTSVESYPSSGQAVLSGADGSKARITVQSATQVLIELDADGNGVYEASASKAWSELL